VSAEQRETLDAILRQSAFPADADVGEQRRLLRELLSGQPLPAEVTAQPAVALYGGAVLVNRLLEASPGLLAAGGIALLEVDPAITGDLKVEGFAGWRLHKDLGGRDRVLEAWI